MFHKLIPYFKIQMRICNFFLLTPYEWPEENKFPIIHRSAWRRYLYRVTLFAQWVYVLSMIVNFMFTLKNNDTASKMLGIVFLDCFLVTLSLRTIILFKENESLDMLTSFLRFEQVNPEAMKQKPDTMGKILMTLGNLTSFGLPFLMAAILFVDPCKPPHLGYMLFKTSKAVCNKPSSLIRACLLVYDLFMWINSISPACYYVFHFMFIGLRCMDHYIEIATLTMSKMPRCKTGGIEKNWPRSTKLSQSSCPKLPSSQPSETLNIRIVGNKNRTLLAHHAHAFYVYRQIHILNKKYDNVLQAVFIPSIITAALSCVIISLYACLKLRRQIPMPGLAFFPLLATDGLSVIFIIEVASAVLKQSNRFLNMTRSNWNFSKQSLYKKVAKSQGKVMIRFGSCNFIDEMTPFVFIDFCFTNTVNLMLIT